jgi:hypothetical protein
MAKGLGIARYGFESLDDKSKDQRNRLTKILLKNLYASQMYE